MTWIGTNHVDSSFPTHDFAVVADSFYAGPDLHGLLRYFEFGGTAHLKLFNQQPTSPFRA